MQLTRRSLSAAFTVETLILAFSWPNLLYLARSKRWQLGWVNFSVGSFFRYLIDFSWIVGYLIIGWVSLTF
jgi:hypothetical protein